MSYLLHLLDGLKSNPRPFSEQWYEQKHDAGYSESHEKAESHWSGTPWTNTEDKK